jgi:hypothetical protein
MVVFNLKVLEQSKARPSRMHSDSSLRDFTTLVTDLWQAEYDDEVSDTLLSNQAVLTSNDEDFGTESLSSSDNELEMSEILTDDFSIEDTDDCTAQYLDDAEYVDSLDFS